MTFKCAICSSIGLYLPLSVEDVENFRTLTGKNVRNEFRRFEFQFYKKIFLQPCQNDRICIRCGLDLHNAVNLHTIVAEISGRVSKHQIRAENLKQMKDAVMEITFCWKKDFAAILENIKQLKEGLKNFEKEANMKKVESEPRIQPEVADEPEIVTVDLSETSEKNELKDGSACEDDDALEETVEVNTRGHMDHIDSLIETLRTLKSRRDLFNSKERPSREISKKEEAVKVDSETSSDCEDEREKTVLDFNCSIFMNPPQIEELIECINETFQDLTCDQSEPNCSTPVEEPSEVVVSPAHPQAPKKRKRKVAFSEILQIKNISWNDWWKSTRSGRRYD